MNCKELIANLYRTMERRKLVVLDDDPTGIQTVHGCLLITDWTEEHVRKAFADDVPFFYILTNTRAMTREEAAKVTRKVMETVVHVNRDFGFKLTVVSRSDSCLRGHFPLETDVMREVLTANRYNVAPKTPFCPALIEAGRVTIEGTHYMVMTEGDDNHQRLVPISETEFARDNVFGYRSSVLTEYIREKGGVPDDYIIVNAQSYDELYAFAKQLANSPYDAVVIRSSSSLPKAISGISDQPLLDRSILKRQDGVGCFVVGSHVKKTTRQLEQLLTAEGTRSIEIDVQRILNDAGTLMQETIDIIHTTAASHLTPVVYTSRQEIRLDDADLRQHLGQQVSDFLVGIVHRLPYTPTYLVGKGGITSHDILTKGLNMMSARVLGQIVPNVPCVMTTKFPYIIFPGNVGNDGSLKEVYEKLLTPLSSSPD